jgi:hypothetical protein
MYTHKESREKLKVDCNTFLDTTLKSAGVK